VWHCATSGQGPCTVRAVTVGDLRPSLNAQGHVDGDGAPDAGCLRPVVRTSASDAIKFCLVKGQRLYLTVGL
jgi:hypothetical protein